MRPKLKCLQLTLGLLLFQCALNAVVADKLNASAACSTAGCNSAPTLDEVYQCIACDSADNKNCQLNPELITTTITCESQCVTALYPVIQVNNPSPKYYIKRECLDELDAETAAICQAGTSDDCATCEGDRCNTDKLRADRLECLHCIDEGCEDPEPQECIAFQSGDQCYTLTDSFNDFVEWGCVSDFEDMEEVNKLMREKLLYKCNGNNCNSFEMLPGPNTCKSCSSAQDVDCVFRPESLTNTRKCDTVPYTDCYERVNTETGVTERGCLIDLPNDEFFDCLIDEKSEKCNRCYGEDCNRAIVPTNRAQCHRCDSTTDPRCTITPQALSVCPIYAVGDMCVSLFENDVVRRGCASDPELSCDANAKNCDKCRGVGCNTVNIKQRSKEFYGMFQELPLNCNTCDGVEDCKSGSLRSRKCDGDKYQDCMSVFNTEGELVRRGCEFAVAENYAEHCEQYPELCFNCKSNGCNDITSPDNYQQCLYCDAATNPDCLFKPESVTTTRKCVEGCLSSLYPRKDDSTIFEFVRACYEDIEQDDRENYIQTGLAERCLDGNICNTAKLPAEGRLTCVRCNGNDCDELQSSQCLAYSATDHCYLYFDSLTNSVSRAGCLSDLRRQDVQAELKQYFLCNGDSCNVESNLPPARECFECNSDNDSDCATNPASLTAVKTCETKPYRDCFARVLPDGHTERGCLQDLPLVDFIECSEGAVDSKCQKCSEASCNGDIFPSDRRSCYRCDSAVDPDCETSPTTSEVCLLYVEDESCVTRLVDGITQRACGSEFDCAATDDDSAGKKCFSCKGNNCNDVNLLVEDIGPPGLFQILPLNCYHCGGASGVDCSTSRGQIKRCEHNNLQTCTIAFDADDAVVQRGCSDELQTTCSESDKLCYDCKSNGCNTAVSPNVYQECLFCDAQKNPDCVYDVNTVTTTRKCDGGCMTALYPRNKDDKVPVYELTRTCLNDLDPDDREECEAGSTSNTCKACTAPNCNTADVGERLSCYHCDGADCLNPEMKECRGVLADDRCMFEFDESNSVIALGCRSKYDEAEFKTRFIERRLWVCEGPNCNTIDAVPKPETCALCNSLTDNNCAVNPSLVASSTTCDNVPATQCYSRVLESGHTERGCAASLPGEDFFNCFMGLKENCNVCSGSKCNAELFPDPRRSCHVCSSETSNTCANSPNSPQVCLLYSSDEQCVTSIDELGVVTRGCSSQLNCDTTDPAKCLICDADNCNNVNVNRPPIGEPGLWQSLPLSCYVCNSETECEAENIATEICSDEENCMTVFNADGKVATRGCRAKVESENGAYCDANSDKCLYCNSNDCNDATSLADYVDCIYCDSMSNKNCVLESQDVTKIRRCHKQCMTALWPRPNSVAFELVRSCLDDKDEADMLQCTGEQCIACNDDKCNVDLLPEQRLSCFKCEHCENFESEVCTAFRADDQCYMLFDEQNEITRMGCLSDLNDDFLEANIKKMYICQGDNCNDQANRPQPQLCVECSSYDEPNCAVQPQEVPSNARCSVLPNTQCYSKVDKNGRTLRGCVSDLNDDESEECLAGSSKTCKSCIGERCNAEYFPADRRSCLICDSGRDADCKTSPTNSFGGLCPLYAANQRCVVKVEGDRVIRGCDTEVSCDPNNSQSCSYCDGDNCNTAVLQVGSIGEPGKWQGLPLSCHKCDGAECLNGLVPPVSRCEGNNKQNCVVVFDENDKVTKRDCSDSVDAAYCALNPERCVSCKSNACNNYDAETVQQFVECYFCDSATNSDCAVNPSAVLNKRKCKSCMTALYPRSFNEDAAYEISRSCLDDKEIDAQTECIEGADEFCQACSEPLCNGLVFLTNRLQCYKCDGDCEEPKVEFCSAYLPDDQCFILVDSETNVAALHGCRSDFESEQVEEMIKQKRLILCDGEACNDENFLPTAKQCKICNSAVDANCATNPSLVSSTTTCSNLPYTDCYTRVDADGYTERGCLFSLPNEDFYKCLNSNDPLCSACAVDNCNAINIFPANRLQCHQCDSSSDEKCSTAPDSLNYCQLYEVNDSCVSKLNNGVTVRGCSSEISCDGLNSRQCVTCQGNGCNTIELNDEEADEDDNFGKWQDLPLSCWTCEGADCDVNVKSLKCENNNEQNCVTVFDAAGKVVRRGCSDAVAVTHGTWCAANKDNCPICKSNDCNQATDKSQFVQCFYCDTQKDSSCLSDPQTVSKTRWCQDGCMSALYPADGSSNPTYELIRSCLNDKEVPDRNLCLEGKDELCVACNADDCNTAVVPANRLSCYQCEGTDCLNPQQQLCPLHKADDKCFIWFDDNNQIKQMGCMSLFLAQSLENIVKTKRISYCDGKNCNEPVIPKEELCNLCDSERDLNCAVKPNAITSTQTCRQAPYTHCYSRFNEDGSIARGCFNDLPADQFAACLLDDDENCQLCLGTRCNSQIIPSDRLSCHVCTAYPCLSSTPLYCSKYDKDDYCFAKYDNGRPELLGCASGQDPNDIEKWKAERKFYQCEGSNCNDLRKVPESGQCLACDSSRTPNCARNPLLVVQYETCAVGSKDCLTRVNNAGDTLRGCLSSISEADLTACSAAKTCTTCTGFRCNFDIFPANRLKCHICNSVMNAQCSSSPDSLTVCQRYLESDECVAKKHPDNLVQRGCASDPIDCTNNQCTVCNTEGCNTIDLSGNAAMTVASALFTLGFAAVAMLAGSLF